MRVSLNLATRPYTDYGPILRQLRIAMGALAVVALLLMGGLHAIHQQAEDARAIAHSLDGRINTIRQERANAQKMMQQPENQRLLARVNTLNQLFDKKTFSWTLAMQDLESVLPSGVQATTLEPQRDDKTGKITLRLRVAGPRDKAVLLVRNLEHSRRFILPRISGESADNGSSLANEKLEPVSASNKVNFDLLADYNPPTDEEIQAAAQKHPAAAHSDAAKEDAPQKDAKPRKAAVAAKAPATQPTAKPVPSPAHVNPAPKAPHTPPTAVSKPHPGGAL